jgi:hypothetical protein
MAGVGTYPSTSSAGINVGGIDVNYAYFPPELGGYTNYTSAFAIVPPGQPYIGTYAGSFLYWNELR